MICQQCGKTFDGHGNRKFCDECCRHERSLRYYTKHRDEIRERRKRYYAEHREEVKEYRQRYCAEHHDKILEQKKRYRWRKDAPK